uniref:ShlB/FhaC/HecB family hemolysin secretion/activation protein n=1 Tax=Pseudomonas sp. TaxID=306 RepID=UPI003A96D13A
MHCAVRYCWLLGVLGASAVYAQTPQSPGDRDLIRDRQERLLDEQQKRLETLQQLPGKVEAPKPQAADPNAQCFDIKHIDLQGAEHLSAAQRTQLLAPYIDQCLGVTQLNDLLKVITTHYLNRGYVTTRAYLPQQDLSSGTLQVIVVEGKLEGLDSSGVASEPELGMTFPGESGEILDLRELEQLVDQLNRLPSRQAELELVPGEAVGGSRVLIKGTKVKPWRVSANRHNDGDKSTGEQQVGLGFDWDSPLGLADQLSLRASNDIVSDQWRHSDNQSLYYSIPYGWW